VRKYLLLSCFAWISLVAGKLCHSGNSSYFSRTLQRDGFGGPEDAARQAQGPCTGYINTTLTLVSAVALCCFGHISYLTSLMLHNYMLRTTPFQDKPVNAACAGARRWIRSCTSSGMSCSESIRSRMCVDADDAGDGAATAEEPTDTPKPGVQQRVHFQTPEANVIPRGSSPSKPALTVNSQSAGKVHHGVLHHNSPLNILNSDLANVSGEHMWICQDVAIAPMRS